MNNYITKFETEQQYDGAYIIDPNVSLIENTDEVRYSEEEPVQKGLTSRVEALEQNKGVQSDWNQTDSTAGDYIKNKPDIPIKTSQLTNDSGYLTEHQDISGKADKSNTYTKTEIDDIIENIDVTDQLNNYYTKDQIDTQQQEQNNQITSKANIVDVYDKQTSDNKFATKEEITDIAYFGSDQGSSTTADFDPQTDTVWNIPQSLGSSAKAQARANINAQETLVSGTNVKTINNESILGQGNITIQGSGEANVIESVSVNNTPVAPDANKNVNITVPAAVTESTVSGWGFTKNTGTYSKPDTGIPASDLAQGVIPDVSGFASKVSNATNGHLAGLDANGNLTDSGYKIVTITESAYEDLATKDNYTLYLITES